MPCRNLRIVSAMKRRISLVNEAHQRISAKLHAGGMAVDATIGNGHDTRFLLQCVAPTGHVYGFDIQVSALQSAKAKIVEPALLKCLTLFHASHASMVELIPERCRGRIDAIMFNLGYLPGSDKTVKTQTNSTLAALNGAGELLAKGGIMTVVAYPGHPEGIQETADVTAWCAALDKQRFDVVSLEAGIRQTAPNLFIINKMC